MKRSLLLCCFVFASPAFSEEFKIGPDVVKVTNPEKYRLCIATRRPKDNEYRTMFMNVGEKVKCPTDPDKFNAIQTAQINKEEFGFLDSVLARGPVRDNSTKINDETVEFAFTPLIVAHKLSNGKFDYVCTSSYRRAGQKEPIGQLACPIVRDGEGKGVVREITVREKVDGVEKDVKTETYECPQIGGDDGCAKKDLKEL